MAGPTLAGATQDEVRRHNLGSLLKLLHVSGPMSRSDLTTSTGLNRSTVGALTAELVDAGLVQETTPVGRGVGRPSIVVAPQEDAVYVVAIELGVERTVVALVGLGGRVMARRDLFHEPGGAPAAVMRRLRRMVTGLLAEVPPGAVCVGVGSGVPGVVRHADGLVEVAPNLGWVDVPLGRLLGEALRTELPLSIANDADLAAMAEHARGAAAGFSHIVHITGDVGVGGGIILDGQLMSGAGGYGGELGHMVVDPDGRRCRCGSQGCWETTIGEEAVIAAVGAPGPETLAERLVDTPEIRRQLAPVGRWLGIGVANLVNIFNPQVVVLGGLFSQTYPLMSDAVNEQLGRALAAPREQVRVRVAELGADSVLVGAAEIAFTSLLADPVGHLARARTLSVV